MTDTLDVESLFAVIGLENILRGRPRLHKYMIQRAGGLPKEMRRRLAKVVATEGVEEAVDMPPFDYDKTLALVSATAQQEPPGLLPEQARMLFQAVPDPDLATDIGLVANGALTWANGALPREQTDTVMGPRLEEPDAAMLASFRRQWQVACDPMAVLADMEDGSLSDDQVAVFAQLFPALYAEMKQALTESLAQVGARMSKDWEPPPLKAGLIRILRQEDEPNGMLAAAAQTSYAKEPTPKQAPSGEPGAEALTPGQKAAGG